MGGEAGGKEAAEICVSTFLSACEDGETPSERVLKQTLADANARILKRASEMGYARMGTTLVLALVHPTALTLLWVGDSRAYLLRDGKLFRLTKDQTLAQMKMEMGMYDEGSPQAEEEKHKLTEYIGRDWTRENLRPTESQWYAIFPKDLVLLCSDGLYDMCSDQEILKILTAPGSPEEKARNLVSMANSAGGHDNITCLLAMFTQPGRR
jgi:protein phosphatase